MLFDKRAGSAQLRAASLLLAAMGLSLMPSGASGGLSYTPADEPTPGVPSTQGQPTTGISDPAARPFSRETVTANPERVRPMTATDMTGARFVPWSDSNDTNYEELKLRWEKSYGGLRPDVFEGVTSRRTDMATIAVGHTMSDSSGRKDAWVVAINDEGQQLWQRTIGGASDDAAVDVVDLVDGSVVIVGDTATDTNGMVAGLVAKIGKNGDLIWQQKILAGQHIWLHAVTAKPGGRLLVAGSSGSYGYIAELDAAGTVLWEKTLQEGPDVIYAIGLRPNGQIVAVGERTNVFDTNAAAAVLSSSGNLAWAHDYGSSENDVFNDVIVLLDGTVLAVGESYTPEAFEQGWMVEIKEDKAAGWSKFYGGPGVDRLTGISVLSDQTLALVGHSDAVNESEANSWVLRVTADGTLIKAKVLGEEYSDGLSEIAARPDGSFATVGFRTTDFDSSRDAYVALLGMPGRMAETQAVARSSDNPPTLFVPGGGELLTDRASVEIVGNVIHSRPIKYVYVDGKPTQLLPNGAFVKHVSIPLGKTTVKVEAVDDRNVIGTTDVTVIRAKGAVTPPPMEELLESIAFGDYHAVVIGNDKYSGDLPALRTATKDAMAVAGILEKDYDFDVDLLINASHDDIVESMSEKRRLLGTDDNLLVYYAGHGYYDEDTDLGYWLPVDAELDSQSKWISNSEIRETIKGMNAKHVLLVADSCFSGTLLRNVDVKRTNKFYEQMATRSARLVMTSGGIEPVMDGGGDGHSVFARSFIRKLSSNAPIIDGTSLFQAIREPVVMTSDQVPQYSNIRFIDSDGGDFLFVRKSALN